MSPINKLQNIDSDALLSAVLKNVNAYVLLINSNVEVLYTNYYDLKGTKAQETDVPLKVGDLLHCFNAERAVGGCGEHALCARCSVRKSIENSFEHCEDFSSLEDDLELVMEDGSVECCHVNVSAKFLEKSEDPRLVLTIHDITLLRNTQKELEEARQKAEESNRSKSVFLSNMGHEINTPLNAILGFSELLIHNESSEDKEQYMDIIRLNAGLLEQLVADILDLSKIEAGTLEFVEDEVELNQLMSELEQIHLFKLMQTNKSIKLFNKSPQEGYRLRIDQHRLMQVMNNFITNAMKFTDNGTIEIGYSKSDEGLYFYVSDTGAGIPEEKLGVVFERFVSLQQKSKGTGLGLAISKSIVEMLGGTIGVKSTLGEGSTFWFNLPYCQDCLSTSTLKLARNGESKAC